MKTLLGSIVVAVGLFILIVPLAVSNQADDTTIRIVGYTAGATPFISNLHLTATDTSVLKSIQFKILPKPGSVTRPLSATYANYYLIDRGFENQQTGDIVLPVYGLYDGYSNTITLIYRFFDGSSKQANFRVNTARFNAPCGYKNPTFLQHRSSAALSYDYFMVKGGCSNFSPAIVDTDGALRWVGTAGFSSFSNNASAFFDNAVYLPNGPKLYRVELDGTVTQIGDYNNSVTFFHHNIDPGKFGVLLESNTLSYFESTIMEVDANSGSVLKTWDLAAIISA